MMPKKADDAILNSLLQGKYYRVETPDQLQNLFKTLTEQYNKSQWIEVQMRSDDVRTLKQNNSLHAYCQDLADAFNDAGILPQHFFRKGFKIKWTMDMIKENIWKPVQKAITKNAKTSKATKAQIIETYDVINLEIGERYGIHVEWKSRT